MQLQKHSSVILHAPPHDDDGRPTAHPPVSALPEGVVKRDLSQISRQLLEVDVLGTPPLQGGIKYLGSVEAGG